VVECELLGEAGEDGVQWCTSARRWISDGGRDLAGVIVAMMGALVEANLEHVT
jgi:hypothetical protein